MGISENILLVGSGPMAVEYYKVLVSMGHIITVIGRGEESAISFENETGFHNVIRGGVDNYLTNNKAPDKAIVAVGEKQIGIVTKKLIENGVKKVLVEKPGGFTSDDIISVGKIAKQYESEVYIGYNRRFYSSVQKAKDIIAQDGGVKSFHFEFTERGYIIKDLVKEEGVLEEWFLANSTHVIDLAFYLGGKPSQISCYTSGGAIWHPSATIYSGAGIAETGALFSYQANWECPGGWGLEVITRNYRLIFKPLEKLKIQSIGTVLIEEVDLNESLDITYKPGLYRQVEEFLNKEQIILPNIDEQIDMLKFYNEMNKKQN